VHKYLKNSFKSNGQTDDPFSRVGSGIWELRTGNWEPRTSEIQMQTTKADADI